MRVLVLALTFALSASVLASDLAPSWGAKWSVNVENTYCEIVRRYTIPSVSGSERRGFLSGTMFNGAFVRFTTTTKTHGDVITADQLDKLRFDLYVYPETQPVPENERIVSASLGGFESVPNVVSRTEIYIFSLNEDESFLLLQRFLSYEAADFELRFADGRNAEFSIYPSGNRDFHVLEGMFQTCVRLNRG